MRARAHAACPILPGLAHQSHPPQPGIVIMGSVLLGRGATHPKAALGPTFHDPGEISVTSARRKLRFRFPGMGPWVWYGPYGGYPGGAGGEVRGDLPASG